MVYFYAQQHLSLQTRLTKSISYSISKFIFQEVVEKEVSSNAQSLMPLLHKIGEETGQNYLIIIIILLKENENFFQNV